MQLPEPFKIAFDHQSAPSTTSYALFCPGNQLESKIIEHINQETSAISIASCMLTNTNITRALVNRLTQDDQTQRITVQIVTDYYGDSYDGSSLQELKDKGALVRTTAEHEFMHCKYIIFHSKGTVIAGSANFTNAGLNVNCENMLLSQKKNVLEAFMRHFRFLSINSTDYAQDLTIKKTFEDLIDECKSKGNLHLMAELQELKHDAQSQVVPQKQLAESSTSLPKDFSNGPVRFANLTNTIVEHITQEKAFIAIAAFRLADPNILDALVTAAARNVGIYLILDSYNNPDCEKIMSNFVYWPSLVTLRTYKSPSRHVTSLMHHKFIIFGNNHNQGPMLLTGSCNFTYSGLNLNREFLMLIKDTSIVKAYMAEYYGLWQETFH